MCNEPEHCETVKALAEENRELKDKVEFIHRVYGEEMNEKLTGDALCLKIASLESRLREAEKVVMERDTLAEENRRLQAKVEAYRKGAELQAGIDWHELHITAMNRLSEADGLLYEFCTEWCEDGDEYVARERIHFEGFKTGCEENRCRIWEAHRKLRGAEEETKKHVCRYCSHWSPDKTNIIFGMCSQRPSNQDTSLPYQHPAWNTTCDEWTPKEETKK